MASNVSKDKFFNIQSNPNLDAADTGVDPKTGKYLSKKERKAIFKHRKIYVSKLFGKRYESSRFGSIVKFNPDDVENQTVDSNAESISDIEKYIVDQSKSIDILKNFIVDDKKSDRKDALEEQKEKTKLDE